MFNKLMQNEYAKKFAIGAVGICTVIIGYAASCAGLNAAMHAGLTVYDGISDSIDKIVNDNKKRSDAHKGASVPVVHVIEFDLKPDTGRSDKNKEAEDNAGDGEAITK